MLMQYSSEALAFQDEELGKWLTAEYAKMLGDPNPGVSVGLHRKMIADAIEQRFYERYGPVFKLTLASDGFHATVNNLSYNSPALYRSLADVTVGKESASFLHALRELKLNVQVDMKNLKLSGTVTEQGVSVNIDIEEAIRLGLTPEELAGVTLHEYGHVFGICYLYGQGVATNLTMSYLHRTYSPKNKAESEEVKNIVFAKGSDAQVPKLEVDLKDPKVKADLSNLSKQLYGDQRLIDQLSVSVNEEAAYMVLVGNMNEAIRNELGSVGIADYQTEGFADHFAVKHGLGRAMVSAMEKIRGVRASEHVRKQSLSRNALTSSELVADVCKFMATGVAGALMVGGAPLVSLTVFAMSMALAPDNDSNYTYNNVKLRYTKVKQMALEYLKNPNADKAQAKKYIDDITWIQEVIERTSDTKTKGLFPKLSRMFWNRKTLKAVDVQLLMDEMGNNEIFLSAAKLAQLQGNKK